MNDQTPAPTSPRWGSTTKMIVGLTGVAAIAALLIQFREIIGPLILALILVFLLHPVIARLSTLLKIKWRTAVNVIYLLLLLMLLGSFTATGFAIVQQAISLVNTVERFVTDLPALVADLSKQVYVIGPFTLDLSQFDLANLAQQVLNVVQPLLGRAGSLVTTLAGGAASAFGWGLFILLASYFLLSEYRVVSGQLVNIDIPGYNADVARLGRELGKTWNAFLRGQLVISFLVIIVYALLLTILGVRLTLAIALMAGAARFVPWIGPLITWTVTALVAFLQPSNYFGLPEIQYTILVLVSCLLVDQIFDNLIVPRLLGQTLGVHPAGVLIAAIVVTNLIGFIGLVLAAPLLATLNLVGRYVIRKMFDLPPWPEEEEPEVVELPWSRLVRRLQALRRLRRRSEESKEAEGNKK
jgi:predicted PurR-regulated permease PerM